MTGIDTTGTVGELDLVSIRARFPALSQAGPDGEPVCFLDGPGGTQVPSSVIEAMSAYLTRANANCGGQFAHSRITDELVARARSVGGAFVCGHEDGIAFGPNMTTLNFLLSQAVGRTLVEGDEIVVTALDHDANVSPWLLLAQDLGLVVREVGLTDELGIDLDGLASVLTERTSVVAFTLASNAVGTLTPAREISELAHSVGALSWADAVHFGTHRRIDVAALGADVLVCSPYKFFGPHLGMAWIRPDLAAFLPASRVRPADELPPGHRFETGTLSHEALAGFVAGVEYLASLGTGPPHFDEPGSEAEAQHRLVASLGARLQLAYDRIAAHEARLAGHFLERLRTIERIQVHGAGRADPSARVSTFGLTSEAAPASALAARLGERSINVWNGNFYALSLMVRLGLGEEGMLRIGMVHYNTEDEVDRVADELAELTR